MGKNKLTVNVELVSPSTAGEWLSKNKNFRKLSERRAIDLSRAIVTGRWELTNDAVAFNCDGELINGQHRLRACIIAQKPIQLLVMRNVDSDTYFDTGQRRTAGQVLAAHGFTGAGELSAAARLLYFYEGPGLSAAFYSSIKVDHGELLRTVERHPLLAESVAASNQVRKLGPIAIFAMVHYLAAKHDREMADLFVYAVATGDGVGKTDSAYWLRERLISIRGRIGSRIARGELMQVTIKAWNLWVRRKPCHQLKVSDGEEFQMVLGPTAVAEAV